jgi:hypothetical protein
MTQKLAELPVVLALFLGLTACQVANPTVASLERAKTLAASGNYAAVAEMDVSCAPSAAGCGQLRRIKADSCRRMAGSAGATDTTRRDALACAVTNYDAALTASTTVSDPQADPSIITLELLEAIVDLRDLSTGSGDALGQDALLKNRAQAATRSAATRDAGLVFGADAELSIILLSGPQGGCEEISRASALLDQANTAGKPLEARTRTLKQSVQNARRARRCAP